MCLVFVFVFVAAPCLKLLRIDNCTDQVIGCDDVDKRKVGGQEFNVVAVCRSGVLQYEHRRSVELICLLICLSTTQIKST